ncbi:MAG: hypothetical protein ISQ32_01760 [Rickettsiales bacterium]|nr:hypothetical protein [Rickettsiales bacterium]
MFKGFRLFLLVIFFSKTLQAQTLPISFENLTKLRFDNISNYSDDSSTTTDSEYNYSALMLELYPKLDFNFNQGVALKTSWVFELLKDPEDSGSFENEGLVLNEFFLNFENDEAALVIGKYNPNFAYLWDQNLRNGIWTNDIAEIYKITGKIAISGTMKMNLDNYGQHDLSLTTFYYDDSNLSDSIFTRRDISQNKVGLASDSGSLSSFTLNLKAEDLNVFDGMFYNLSYRFLTNDASLNIEDEEGYSVTFGFKKNFFNNLVLKPVVEFVDIQNFNSFNNDFNQEFGDDQYLPADFKSIIYALGLEYRNWGFNVMMSKQDYTKLQTTDEITVEDFGVSARYRFENNFTIRAGTRNQEQDNINMSKDIITVQFLYDYQF